MGIVPCIRLPHPPLGYVWVCPLFFSMCQRGCLFSLPFREARRPERAPLTCDRVFEHHAAVMVCLSSLVALCPECPLPQSGQLAAALRALSIVSASTRWPPPCSAYSPTTHGGAVCRCVVAMDSAIGFFGTGREESAGGGGGESECFTLMTPFLLHTRCVDFVTHR